MFVVAGATGNTGSVVANILLDRGQKVRVLVRTPEKGEAFKKRGAEVAVGTLEDTAALERAFAGAKGVYVLAPPDHQATDLVGTRAKMFDGVAAVLAKTNVPHVVLLSSVGAHHPEGTGPIKMLHRAEKVLGERTALTSVRAGYFLENYMGVIPLARSQGVLPTFFPPDAKIPTVTTNDIGRCAAEALLAGPKGRRILELSSFEASANDVAATLGELLDKKVTVQQAPLSAVVPTFKGMGLGEPMAKLYEEMIGGGLKGLLGFEGKGTERVHGWTDLKSGLSRLLG